VEAKYGEAIDVSSAVSGSIIPANAVLAADEAIVFKIEGDTLPEDGELMAHVWYKMADCIEDEAAVAS
jgi:mRNA-degrading endonuclease HigB of HigAB toxin-antitoxin module